MSLFDKLISRVSDRLRKAGLDFAGKRLVVFVSGGPDSIFLLHALRELHSGSARLSVVHVNYALRGNDSLLDQKLVEAACADLQIPCRVVNPGPRPPGNLQAWAREIRLEVMRGMRRGGEADYFFLGHQQGDILETLFMKLARGASPAAFASLSVKSGRMIRPLLDLSKNEIVDALNNNGVPFRTDRSNLGNAYERNRIRNTLFSELDRQMPEWRRAFAGSAEHWAEAAGLLKRTVGHSLWISRIGKKAFCLRKKFHALPKAEAALLLQSALRKYFPKKRFSRNLYNSIFQKVSAGKNGFLFLWGKDPVVFDSGLIGAIKPAEPFQKEIHLDETVWMSSRQAIRWESASSAVEKNGIQTEEINQSPEWRDPSKVFYFSLPSEAKTLTLRSRKPGDCFLPHGLPGNSDPVKLKDWFISHHVPRFLRDRARVVEVAGEIVGILIHPPKRLARLQSLRGKTPSSAAWISRKFLEEKHGLRCRIFITEKPVVG
ncbi:MAG: tRNA lysidine(34) synthetase TilS [Spirochaetia bacterium]|nr:tRNA lysidine(34) synthetase TilS [Spirochaetia bacterium]